MKNYLIDTNVLISFLTNRNIKQQKIITPYFKKVENCQSIITLHFNTITEFVYVLDKIYHVEEKEIHSLINHLIYTKGIKIVYDINEINVLKIWPEKTKDWGDAILTAYALDNKDSIILTFDKKFRSLLKSQKVSFEEI